MLNFGVAYKDPLDPRAKETRLRHYRKNKEVYVARARALVKELREITNKAKSVPCMDCGVSYPPYVMDFDHRDPSKKDGVISQMVGKGSKAKLLQEIEKCDVVCSNCHRGRTYTRNNPA